MRRFTSIALAFAFVLSMFSVGGGGNVAAEESFDCGSLEGLQVLHSTLREQADGGYALFESISEQCRQAYLDAQAIVRVEVETGGSEDASKGAMLASGCTNGWVSARYYTLLGFTAYRYVQSQYFCWNGSYVYSHSVSHWIDNVDPNFQWQGGTVQYDYASSSGFYTQTQGVVANCPFNWCTGTTYPGAWVQSYGSGYWEGDAWA